MSLLSRIQTNQNTQQNTPSNTANAPANNGAFSRPGFGANANNTNNTNNTPANNNNAQQPAPPLPRKPAPPPSPFQTLDNAIVPMLRAVVRFELAGLGDPFYRLLGHPLNADLGDVTKLAALLEAGGEAVDALTAKLDEIWEAYQLNGASLVYPYDSETALVMANPQPMAAHIPNRRNADNNNDDDIPQWLQNSQPSGASNASAVYFRALDLALTLNVLGRSRSQVLIAHAPIVYDSRMLVRSLITEDPRLVALARASGAFIEPQSV